MTMPSEIDQPADATPPQLVRRGWNPPLGGAWGWMTARRARRLFVTLAALGLLAWFAWLVWAPFWHPRVQVVCLSGADYKVLRVPPIAFAAEDVSGLATLSNLFDESIGRATPYVWDSLAEPAKMQALGPRLRQIADSESDVLILVVSAHGMIEDGETYLVCRNFDPANPSAGRYNIRDFLRQIRSCAAAVKLLVLDVGRIEQDPRLGYVWNDLAARWARAVRATGDETLWLMTANGIGESSQLAVSLEQSVFGYALQWGLAGAADGNEDRVVSLDELHRYVSATVSDWVDYVGGGDAAQHPLLAWGGVEDSNGVARQRAAAGVIVAPVPGGFDRAEMPTLQDQVRTARSTSRGEAWYLARIGSTATPGGSAAVSGEGATRQSSGKAALAASVGRINLSGVRSVGQLRAQTDSQLRDAGHTAMRQSLDQRPSSANSAANAPAAPAPSDPVATASPQASESVGGATSAAPEAGPAAQNAAATAAAGTANPPNAATSAANSRTELPKLFAEAWRLRDEMDRLPTDLRPVDYAPHLWREMECALLDYELQYRAGRVGNAARLKSSLGKLSAGQKALLSSATEPDAPSASAGPLQMLRYRPRTARELSDPFSMAMTALIARRQGAGPEPEAASLDQLEAALLTDQSAFLAKAQELAQTNTSTEIQDALALGQVPAADWPTAALTWRAITESERLAAAAPWIVPFVGTELDAADALLWAGERELLDGVGPDHALRAQRLVEQSLASQELIAGRIATVEAARRIEREFLHFAPYLARMHVTYFDAPGDDRTERPSLPYLCDRLQRLSTLLIVADPANIDEMRALTEELPATRTALESQWNSQGLERLLAPPPRRGDALRVQTLLSTPLLGADDRLRLLAIASRLDGRLLADLSPAAIPATMPAPVDDAGQRTARMSSAAELHAALARLAGCHDDSGDNRPDRLEQALSELREALAHWTHRDDASLRTIHERFAAFQADLAVFYAALPGSIADLADANRDLTEPSTRAERLHALRRAERGLRSIDGRDARRTGDVPVCQLIDAADWHTLLVWHAARAERAADQADGERAGLWARRARQYRRQAASIFPDSADGGESPPSIVLEGPERVDLTVEPNQDIELELTSRETAPTDVWLLVKYDPALVSVVGNSQVTWYMEHELDAVNAGDEDLVARVRTQPASLRAKPGQTLPLRFRASAVARTAQPVRVIVQAVTQSSTARSAIGLALPTLDTVDLAIQGTPGTWRNDSNAWMLTPFPNRENAFQLSLVNATPQEKTVNVELLAPTRDSVTSMPSGSLSIAEAAEFLLRLGPTERLALAEKVTMPARGLSVAVPFPAPMPDEPAPAASPGADPQPPLPEFEHGLLVAITDTTNGRVSLHRIEVAPQRPRRYIRPRVRYNAIDERIEVDVTAQDPAAMPDGPVRVACDVVESLPPGTQARLSDELQAPDYMAKLWIAAPLDPARIVTLRLSVDDYPRAFTFRVPCQETGRDIPPEEDLLAMRVTAPAADVPYKAPAAAVDVAAEIDVPRAAEDDPEMRIELGFDTDRDREFRGESTTRLPRDRQVVNRLVMAGPGGRLVIASQVTDYRLPLQPPGLVNNRVGVLGRVMWHDRVAYSEAREIILDGASPRIAQVRLAPTGVAPIGEPLTVTCLALDGELSGVATVEATIDQVGTAEFEGNPAPAPAKPGADGRWTAQVDTATVGPGTYHVLVRATDKVGNVGEIDSQATVRLMTPEAIADARRKATNRITGTVLYAASGFAGIEVQLTKLPDDAPAGAASPPPSPDDAVIAPVTSGDAGAFRFEQVPPGKYKLTAQGVVRNKTRRAEAEITVEPGPTASRPLRLELK